MPGQRKTWNRIGRLSGSDAGKSARPVYLCASCRCWHGDTDARGKLIKPMQCKFCGRFEFDRFDSSGEAQTWCKLWLRVKAGEIRKLERQIKIDLLTVGREGLARVWASAVLDFSFEELRSGEWVFTLADHKPSAGISPDSALKFRCLEKMGRPVRIFTENGEI